MKVELFSRASGAQWLKFTVKNASRPKPVIFTGPGREAFCVSGWLDCNSDREVIQVFSARRAEQSLQRYRQGWRGIS